MKWFMAYRRLGAFCCRKVGREVSAALLHLESANEFGWAMPSTTQLAKFYGVRRWTLRDNVRAVGREMAVETEPCGMFAVVDAATAWENALETADMPEATIFEVAYRFNADALEVVAEVQRRGSPIVLPAAISQRTVRAVNRWLGNLRGQHKDGTVTDVARLFDLAPEALHASLRRRCLPTRLGVIETVLLALAA